ncbi:MAG: DUF1697 domain-containing protein [Gemmatimonadales bacterium]
MERRTRGWGSRCGIPAAAEVGVDVPTHVAFLRAINVGGHAIVKMTALRDAFAAAGCKNVRTLIQSGNVVFDAPAETTAALVQRIRAKLRDLLGDEPGVFFRTIRDIARLVKLAPFKRFATRRGIKLYVAFLSQKPRRRPRFPLRSASEALDVIGMKRLEVFVVSGRKKNGFYGFPNALVEKELGVPATSRNWSTIMKIVEAV